MVSPEPPAVRRERTDRERGRQNREQFMKRFDKNGDGKLDEAERAAAKAAFGNRRRTTDAAPAKAKPDKGRVNKEELLKKFDADGDGKLTGDERAAARKSFEDRKPKAEKE